MASSIILRVCCGVCPVVTQPGRSGTYAHQLLAAFSKTTAYFISAPFALLPEPRPPLSLEIVPDNPKDTVFFNLGPHPPCLWPEDVELAHQLWLERSATGPGAKLHHRDVIGIALRRMIAELHSDRSGEVVDDVFREVSGGAAHGAEDRKSTRLNSSHRCISYAVFCLKKK